MGIEQELAEILRTEVERHRVPGAAAGVLVDGECHTAAHGVTNVEHPLEVDETTLFQVGSITKTFTSTAVMLLVEAGALSLDDPVAKHLPELGRTTGLDLDAITVEHLLSHQAGFDGDHLFVGRVADTLDALRGARELFAPGTEYSYNNAAFSITGAVIETVSGRPFESFVRERLLRPLDLRTACFSADDAITHRVAAPHFVLGDLRLVIRGLGWQPGWELGPVDRPAGGLIASVEHLLAWCRFQLTGTAVDGTALISRESLSRLHTPVVTEDLTSAVGLDWFVRSTDGVTTIEHGGLTAGYCSTLVVAPERNVGVVCLTHATNGAAVNETVRRWALEHAAGIRERDPEPDPSIPVDATRFAGTFLYPFGLLTLSAGDSPGTILVTTTPREDVDGWKPPPDPPMTLGFFAEDHAVTVDAPGPARVARFGFGASGNADWILWAGRRSPRVG